MAIVRWDPWRELAGIERQFDEVFGRGRTGSRAQGTGTWVPALDVHQDGDTMVICAEIAGVDPQQVEITLDDDVLTVSGRREEDRKVEEGQWIRRERMTGQFRRSISLPPGVDPQKVKANAKNGVIEIRVPRPTKSEPHRIELAGGNGQKQTAIDVESSSEPTGGRQRKSDQTAGTGDGSSSRSSRGTAKKASKSTRASRT